ncbi:MAG: FAD-dependent thymidylate synthase [Nanoarchaeota archaeon]|nr:FAD-dependent thymidylate synthase [Nanoarchaeota archaeon]
MEDDFSKLKHTSVNVGGDGEVIVLDTGAIINAEAEAMLQALHSRSTGGLRHHLKVLGKKGPDIFMKDVYVGYGHKSIGDCGTTSVFVEGVSMLVAKAIQDNPLYSGQESSTRYLDFSKQPFRGPIVLKEVSDLLETQRKFYLYAQEPTREQLRQLHPQQKREDEKTYNKAINARAFDITRSLLPAGALTNLAWHTNLRQAADKILFLRHHPLQEVRNVAKGLEQALKKHYPNSFTHKRYEKTENYQDIIANHYLYHDLNSPKEPVVDLSKIDLKELSEYQELFSKRPEKTELPKYLSQIGTIDARFQLDFGSFRDIQRHRAIIQRMPLLTSDLGFEEWYVENFSPEVREKLPEHLYEVCKGIKNFAFSPADSQYLLPMGYKTSNRFTGDLPATIYMLELRDSRFVHPTLQKVAHSIGKQITSNLGIPLHVDPEPNRFDVKRGEQDIVIK